MIAAFSTWDNRIAPVFDVARLVCLVNAAPGRVIRKSEEILMGEAPVQKALRLTELGADTLVCGAISRPVLDMFSGYGIRVYPFVAGDLQAVIDAWLRGALDGDLFAMPGCRGRTRGQIRARRGVSQAAGPASAPRKRSARSGDTPGRGRGARMRAQGSASTSVGPGAHCICPQCGQRQPHQRGEPCFEQKCPTCNVAMIRA
jgi:predicted Fe-Mo cluster-binding NifX family protein